MRAAELLAHLEASGFRLWIDGDELSGEGPPEMLEELLGAIREAKVELIGLLRADPPAPHPKPRQPGPEAWRLDNELSILGPEMIDPTGEDRDLLRSARRGDDWRRVQISKY